jgi:hypothetical protein
MPRKDAQGIVRDASARAEQDGRQHLVRYGVGSGWMTFEAFGAAETKAAILDV